MPRRRRPGEGTIWKERRDGRLRFRMRGIIEMPDGTHREITASAATEALARERFGANIKRAQADTLRSTSPTLAQRTEHWLGVKKHDVSARTLHDYRRLLEQHVHPVLGDRPLDEIRISDVVPILERLKADGKYATADYVRRVLKQLFSHAVLDEKLVVSPTAELRGQRSPKRGRLDETGSATTGLQIWTPDEIKTFLAALDGNPAREMLIVALFTGLRRGEIVALRREDVSADFKRLSVRRAHDPFRPEGFGPPKSNGSIREVYLGKDAQAAVRDAIAKADQRARTTARYREEGWLFPNAVGGMYDPRNYALQFTKAIRTANTDADGKVLTGRKVRLRTIRLHGLRHTFASYLARSGQPPAIIQRLLGHATPDLALRVYTHVMEIDMEKATLDLDDILGR